MLTQQYLRQIFEYDYDDGWLVWKHRSNMPNNWNGRFAGKLAGSVTVYNCKPYIAITVDYKQYLAHRLIWVYEYGEWVDRIDHKDDDGTNNRLSNLRACTHSQNMMNKKPGRGWEQHGKKFRARLYLNGQRLELGSFDTPREAEAAYIEARKKHYGEFAR